MKTYIAETRFKKKSVAEIERLTEELKGAKDKKEVLLIIKKLKEELSTSLEVVDKTNIRELAGKNKELINIGLKTINQVRTEYGLKSINDGNKLITTN